MFDSTGAFGGFSIRDLEESKTFYGDVLGMDVLENDMGFLELHLASGGRVLAYTKPDHEPASFTILNFEVDDIEAAVDDLNAKGVDTKIYDDSVFPSDAKGIVSGYGPSIAWFRDPSGNVLAVLERVWTPDSGGGVEDRAEE